MAANASPVQWQGEAMVVVRSLHPSAHPSMTQAGSFDLQHEKIVEQCMGIVIGISVINQLRSQDVGCVQLFYFFYSEIHIALIKPPYKQ